MSFGLNLRSARALSEVGGINKNVSNGWMTGKKAQIMTQKSASASQLHSGV